MFRVVIRGKAGYINEAGRLVIAPRFNPYYIEQGDGDFRNGLALVFVSEGLGFIDETGRVQPFDGLKLDNPFAESITIATRASEGRNARNVLLVDSLGHVTASVEAAWVHSFSEGWAEFAENNPAEPFKPYMQFGHRRGYIDRSGRVTIAPKFAYAGPFSEGLAAVALDGSCWVAGWQGGKLPAPSATSVITSCGPRPADEITQPCRHGYIDKTGRMVIPPRYELAREFAGDRAAVRVNGKWGFVDHSGTEIISHRFDEVRSFADGKAAVRIGKKWGFVDRLGVPVVEFRFDDALSFSQGLAAVKTGDHYCYINDFGAEVIPGAYLQATQFVKGLAHVQLGQTKWAWINEAGKAIFTYDWKQEF